MMIVTEIVLRNTAGEIARHEIKTNADGEVNLTAELNHDFDIRTTFGCLRVGDTITVEERWTERD